MSKDESYNLTISDGQTEGQSRTYSVSKKEVLTLLDAGDPVVIVIRKEPFELVTKWIIGAWALHTVCWACYYEFTSGASALKPGNYVQCLFAGAMTAAAHWFFWGIGKAILEKSKRRHA